MAKGPKTLNPADRARKEARKKELKKNKKQRQQVRSAAIECRDPHQIVAELEVLDKHEFDIDSYRRQSSSGCFISDTLFKDKRKRLKELYARILNHYEKEDPEKHAALKALEAVYEAKHKRAQREFEAVKAAEHVRIEDVFLPPEVSEADDDDKATPASQGDRVPIPGQVPNFKHLVESHKVPNPSFAAGRFLPANQRKKINQVGGRPTPYDRPGGSAGNEGQQSGPAPNHGGSKSTVVAPQEQTKSTVIESKPVIFVPKVTKFVPASVRSKLNAPKK